MSIIHVENLVKEFRRPVRTSSSATAGTTGTKLIVKAADGTVLPIESVKITVTS